MKEKTAILQQSDRYIMEKLWEKSPMTTIQLYHELKIEPGWSKSTVFTLLSRMTEKGIIYYKEDGKVKQYYPAIGKDEAAAAETASLLKRVFKGSAGMMMNTMLKENMFSKDEIDELYDMLKKGE